MANRPRRSPLLSLPIFVATHDAIDVQLKGYLVPLARRSRSHAELLNRFMDGAARSGYFANNRARIAFARALEQNFRAAFGRKAATSFVFLTIAPPRFAMSLEKSRKFDPGDLIWWARQRLSGVHFIGMVEAGYFSNWPPQQRSISWHVHIIAWDWPVAQAEQLVSQINAELPSFVPGRSTAHCRRWSFEPAVSRTIYMAKAPKDDQRVVRSRIPHEPPRLKSRPLRPGDAVRLYKAAGAKNIRQLSFAGGDGQRLLDRALDASHKRIRREDKKRIRGLRKLVGL